ncbi:MAG TPA: hypothetical protein VFE13_21260 [Caulobacteraceae bacterium]|nr:hypothetical protein [Caulobacteraceae bacterium]
MRHPFAFALAAALMTPLIAGLAAAQPAPAGKPAPPSPRIFLSPSGEPFRQSPAVPDTLKAWFDGADLNHDSAIDRFEFRADAARFFKLLDANGDGVIDGFETADYESKIAPELAEQAEGRLPGMFGPGHDAKPGDKDDKRGRGRKLVRVIGQLLPEPEPVTGADFDLDGKISQADWMRAADQRFDLLDTAHAGRLPLEALRQRLAHPQQAPR